jgi:eukaryotic-like serine/threonine-protein kinase
VPDSSTSTLRVPLPEQILAGRYRLIKRLGQGGMGLVFLAEQVGVGNKVAIKFLDPEDAQADDSRVARFLREGRVGLEVKHPGAVQLLDTGTQDEGQLYLVFEYVEGFDLRELLTQEGHLPFEEARTIVLRIAETLAFAHNLGIIHRDIKPENIRVRRDLAGTHVKLLDFGIARMLKSTSVRLTAEGMLTGTPRYMAPEQIHDGEVDGRTDIYCVGLIFFEMLAGMAAFNGKNIADVLSKQVKTPMPTLSSIDDSWNSPDVDAFLQKACAKKQAERFQSMQELIVAVQALKVPAFAARTALMQGKLTPKMPRQDFPTEPSFSKPGNASSPVQKINQGLVPTVASKKPAENVPGLPLKPALIQGPETSMRTPIAGMVTELKAGPTQPPQKSRTVMVWVALGLISILVALALWLGVN